MNSVNVSERRNRNSLIELYRFIFAINVVKFHSYFFLQSEYFSKGSSSVEFFFVLTGFFLIRSIDKYKNQSVFKGIFGFTWKKICSLGLPLLIGIIFNVIYSFSIQDSPINIWIYLWYIRDMFKAMLLYFLIRKFIKNEKIFLLITFAIAITFNILHFTGFYDVGFYRALASVSVGILTSYLPDIFTKNKKYVWYLLTPTMIIVSYVLIFNCPLWFEIILNNALYPLLIYLTCHIKISCKFFDYLGSLSFGLYAFQSIAKCARLWGVNNLWILFILILIPTIIERFLRHLYIKKVKVKTVNK